MRLAFLEQLAAAVLVIGVFAISGGVGTLPSTASDSAAAPALVETDPLAADRGVGAVDLLEAARSSIDRVPIAIYEDHAPVFAHYYMWWTARHWRNKLGPEYEIESTFPLTPALLHQDGCTASSRFNGNTLLDVPPELYLVDQDAAGTFDLHIAQAASAGIDGFAVAWPGDGTAGQTPTSNRWNQRLAAMVAAVERFNEEDGEFRLMVAYQSRRADRTPRPVAEVANDLAYLAREYTEHPVFRIADATDRPLVSWMGSSSYRPEEIRTASASLRSEIALIGNEHRLENWERGVADSFDGDHWYWSSQNPATNPASFAQLRALASAIHDEDKLWLAPIAPGFNISNFGLGGSCVPREQGETMRRLYESNVTSQPDLWLVISWNEFLENTYVQPSLRYGSRYLDLIREIFGPVQSSSSPAIRPGLGD
jgi:hypothetical protein